MDKLKKIVFEVINLKTEGVDTYHNNGSMWLIFTDKKKWVIELTKQGTLWYNYIFFQDCFKYLSLDVIKNQHYITKWVEDIIQNGLINTFGVDVDLNHLVEDTIQNGVKETDFHAGNLLYDVEDTIQNGVKHTEPAGYLGSIEIKGKIVHQLESPKQNEEVEDVIENEVINTFGVDVDLNHLVEDTIQNGVKETKKIDHDRTTYHGYFNQERGSHTPLDTVQDVIENGIKEVKELPDMSGELNGYGEYYARQKNRTYPHTDTVNDVIRDGIKETHADAYHYIPTVEGVITNNVKETNWRRVDNFPEFEERVIKNGIKL
jgi:hypothetical protein